MRIFQAIHKYNPYIPAFEKKYNVSSMSFDEHIKTLIQDRFYASHILKPVLDFSRDVFYTIWDYEDLQLKWAREKGSQETDLKKILFAQIEEFQPDVFYNMSPVFFTKEELNLNLDPKIVRVCWSATPFYDEELFKLYKTRLTNLPTDVKPKSEVGFRSDLFQPAHDPAMNQFAMNKERPIDLFFYGQYSRLAFKRRNQQLDRLFEFKKASKLNIEILLQYKEESKPIIKAPYLRYRWRKTIYPPSIVRNLSGSPVYGRDLYQKISQSKIVFNAGVDFTKEYKVNMRNFEVLGCGAHMISDDGIYPKGFQKEVHFSTYKNMEDCIDKIEFLLENEDFRVSMAEKGHQMVKDTYTKEKQWNDFIEIIEAL
jgi:hypothetical protein